MPSKNTQKIYIKDGFYHIYNRGVAKMDIFKDDEDFSAFLWFLRRYVIPASENIFTKTPKFLGALINDIDIVQYCLMPNHFHLLIRQKAIDGMETLLRRVCTSYSRYFNKKYDRVGPLFQGVYKAVHLENERQLLAVSRYIHRNPESIANIRDYKYSSYQEFLGLRKSAWIKSELVLKYFKSVEDYAEFVEKGVA